jgi:predicted nucleotidyltransferase
MKLLDNTAIPIQPYPELREVLKTFVTEVQAELGENLVGVYLVGSLASGDFDLDSDIDFVVVIDTELNAANENNLQAIQRKIYGLNCYPAQHLEGSYISLRDLNDWHTVGKKQLYYFDNGSTTFEYSIHDNNWHVRWILRERGIPLIGPAPATLLPPIPTGALSGEMQTAMCQIMRAYEEAIRQPLNFFNSQFGHSFVVLTFCRMLHTLHTGEVQSKKAGAQWAQQYVTPEWRELIGRAWDDRKGVRFGVKIGQRAAEKLLYQTLEFIQYAVAQSGVEG